jgi:hypothetical protein
MTGLINKKSRLGHRHAEGSPCEDVTGRIQAWESQEEGTGPTRN